MKTCFALKSLIILLSFLSIWTQSTEEDDNHKDIPDPPGKPLVIGYTSRSVNLSWTPSSNTYHLPVLNYIIDIRVGEDGEWDIDNRIATLDNKTHYNVDKLQPFTVYSFRVLAVNSIGVSQPSKQSYYVFTLRERPAEKPILITTQSTNNSSINSSINTSIQVQWMPPNRDTIHGEFLGYIIKYRKPGHSVGTEGRIILRDIELTSHTLTNLQPFTQYVISLQIFNPAGEGPATTVTVSTDEGISSSTINVTQIQTINTLLKRNHSLTSLSSPYIEPTLWSSMIARVVCASFDFILEFLSFQ